MESEIKGCNLFPLGIFVLPGSFVNLHIYEERFKAMVQKALQNSEPFGILTTLPENTPNLGTLVRVVEITKRYPDGRMDILVRGESLFQLIDFEHVSETRPYPFGTVTPINYLRNMPVSTQLETAFLAYTENYATVTGDDISINGTLRLLDLAAKLQLDEVNKLQLALLQTPEKQMHFIYNQLVYLNAICQQEKRRFMGFYLN